MIRSQSTTSIFYTVVCTEHDDHFLWRKFLFLCPKTLLIFILIRNTTEICHYKEMNNCLKNFIGIWSVAVTLPPYTICGLTELADVLHCHHLQSDGVVKSYLKTWFSLYTTVILNTVILNTVCNNSLRIHFIDKRHIQVFKFFMIPNIFLWPCTFTN